MRSSAIGDGALWGFSPKVSRGPSSSSNRTASTRELTPSLRQALATWASTVLGVLPVRRAIVLLR